MLDPRIRCDDDNAARKAGNDREEAAAEIFASAESSNNDRDVVRAVGGCGGQSDGLECPGRNNVDYQAGVSPEPMGTRSQRCTPGMTVSTYQRHTNARR